MNVRLHFLARAWNMKSERNKTTVNTLNCAAFRPSKLFHHLEQQWNHFILKWLKASLHDNVVTAKNKLWRRLPSIPLDLYLRLVFVLMLRMSYNIFIFTKQQIYWTFQSSLSKQLKRVLQWVPMLTVPAYSFPSLILLCLACMPFLPGHPDFFSKPGLYCAHSLLSPAFGEGKERHVPVPSCSEASSPQTSS